MDFLTRLAQRVTGELPTVQPRLPVRFEPTAGPRAVTWSEAPAEVAPIPAGVRRRVDCAAAYGHEPAPAAPAAARTPGLRRRLDPPVRR